jgi:hypothetical protein
MGTMFYRVDFSNFDGPAVKQNVGPTNFFAYNWRADRFPYFVFEIAVNNAASRVTIGQFTTDNTDAGANDGTGGGGVVHLDGSAAVQPSGGNSNNKTVSLHLHDGKIEVNETMIGDKAIVLCTRDAAASQGIAHRIHLDDIEVAKAAGASEDFTMVQLKSSDSVDSQYIQVYANKVMYAPGSTGDLIRGVVDPHDFGTMVGKFPSWSYTPRGFGFASGTENVMNDLQSQYRMRDLIVGLGSLSGIMVGATGGRGVMRMHNALANPSANPTGGGILYVDAGALKYRGSSGTVTTIANA